MSEKPSFVFYRSFYEAVSSLDDLVRVRLFDAICDYALNGKEPDLEGIERAVFTLVKPQLDANSKRYENGKKGGRPNTCEKKKNQTKTKLKPKNNQEETKPEPNVNVNVNENVEIKDTPAGVSKPESVSQSVWQDFKAHRKAKKAPITRTVMDAISREAEKAGWSIEKALIECCARNWQTFKADWISKDNVRPLQSKQARQIQPSLAEAMAGYEF